MTDSGSAIGVIASCTEEMGDEHEFRPSGVVLPLALQERVRLDDPALAAAHPFPPLQPSSAAWSALLVRHDNPDADKDRQFTAQQLEDELWKTSLALSQVQKQIQRGEETYFEESSTYGANVFRGFDTFLDARLDNGGMGGGGNVINAARRMPGDFRWFSSSCTHVARHLQPQIMGTQVVPTGQPVVRKVVAKPHQQSSSSSAPPFNAKSELEDVQEDGKEEEKEENKEATDAEDRRAVVEQGDGGESGDTKPNSGAERHEKDKSDEKVTVTAHNDEELDGSQRSRTVGTKRKRGATKTGDADGADEGDNAKDDTEGNSKQSPATKRTRTRSKDTKKESPGDKEEKETEDDHDGDNDESDLDEEPPDDDKTTGSKKKTTKSKPAPSPSRKRTRSSDATALSNRRTSRGDSAKKTQEDSVAARRPKRARR